MKMREAAALRKLRQTIETQGEQLEALEDSLRKQTKQLNSLKGWLHHRVGNLQAAVDDEPEEDEVSPTDPDNLSLGAWLGANVGP